ncbi:MAG: nickel pincer cofactor biosynthesis protein LarC [Candidatus Rokubacteria bacterium]|nr:nickel pincer cofactor biosynthesis protein LarC [Candidatus Rokubacteria bacterium]
MRIAYFDCPAGASGDMILGALVDAGCALAALEEAIRALGVSGWRLTAQPVERAGLRGTHVVVETDRAVHFHDLGDLLAPIKRSTLPDDLKERATAILVRLAEAESRVHRVPVAAVHFHEVGALDTLVDVVGALAGLEALGIEAVHVSALPLGGGAVESAHGRLPVPAPATVELLRGFPVYDNGVQAELVTPTGAAILTTLGTPGHLPPMTLRAVGWGAGTRELPIPNLLRVLVGESAGPRQTRTEPLAAIETTIDDMSPQLYEPLMERLLEAGALDVYLTPVIMKRSRPGIVLTAWAAPDRVAELASLLFRETTTIGVRWHEFQRARLPRELARVETSLGPVTFKLSRLGGRAITVTPEFEEVRRIARERGLPVREVLEQVRAEGLRVLGASGTLGSD